MQLVLKIYWLDPTKTLTWSVEMKKKQKTQKIWKSFYLKNDIVCILKHCLKSI